MKIQNIFVLLTVVVFTVHAELMAITENDLPVIKVSNEVFNQDYVLDIFKKDDLVGWLKNNNIETQQFDDMFTTIDNLVKEDICKKETWVFEIKNNVGKINYVLVMLKILDNNVNLYSEFMNIEQQIPAVYTRIHHEGSSSHVPKFIRPSGAFKQPWDENVKRELNMNEINLITNRLLKRANEYIDERKKAIGF
jgi:hypothetical protein